MEPQFLEELREEFGPEVFDKTMAYAEKKGIFEKVSEPEKTLISMLIREMTWRMRQKLYLRYQII